MLGCRRGRWLRIAPELVGGDVLERFWPTIRMVKGIFAKADDRVALLDQREIGVIDVAREDGPGD